MEWGLSRGSTPSKQLPQAGRQERETPTQLRPIPAASTCFLLPSGLSPTSPAASLKPLCWEGQGRASHAATFSPVPRSLRSGSWQRLRPQASASNSRQKTQKSAAAPPEAVAGPQPARPPASGARGDLLPDPVLPGPRPHARLLSLSLLGLWLPASQPLGFRCWSLKPGVRRRKDRDRRVVPTKAAAGP